MSTEETHIAVENPPAAHKGTFLEVLRVFAKLGISSFGGPVAHLGYFRQEIVVRRKWVDEAAYADLIGLTQFLPGPSSSQTGIALGITRAGLKGGLAAWLGFTLPSAIAMTVFAYLTTYLKGIVQGGWLQGLLIAAVAVVATAVWGMARTLSPDLPRATMAIAAAVILLLWPLAAVQIGIIALAGLCGWFFLRKVETVKAEPLPLTLPRRLAVVCGVVFFALLIGLPVLRQVTHNQGVALFDTFYRVGSLVFGGGHVVLPLLQREVVPAGWVTNDQFLAGYAAAQAAPFKFP